MSELMELAGRCEKATGLDRELDCLIFESRHRLLTAERRGSIDGEPTGQYFDLGGNLLPECAPFYTASIDAAMTLAPEGWHWDVGNDNIAIVRNGKSSFESSIEHCGVAPSPALALCAASLRARATIDGGRDNG